MLDRAVAGDDAAFAELVAPLQAELHAHCYRMLGSVHDADDALQEALVRAWRGLSGFAGRSSLRSWMYSIATNSCIDAARSRQRRALPVDLGPASAEVVADAAPRTDVAWLGPHPDERYEQREAVELAFVAAMQHLPPNQRAALLLFEVLGFSAAEIAEQMATSTASVNSALQRARSTVGPGVPGRAGAPGPAAPCRRRRVRGGAGARRRRCAGRPARSGRVVGDAAARRLVQRPPDGRGVRQRTVPFGGACGIWRTRPTTANGAAGGGLLPRRRRERGFTAWSINILDVRDDGSIAGDHVVPRRGALRAFGLPTQL